jgi:predicted DCC family thiol-disulfide oxidoreductase YuxK
MALRDSVYRVVARNRYRILGKRDRCRVPSEQERSRFLP